MRQSGFLALDFTGRLNALVVGIAALTLANSASGFDSYGIFPEHGQITALAGAAKGWADSAISNLQKYNRTVDWDETSQYYKDVNLGFKTVSAPDYLGPNDKYRYFHHFDRGKNGANFRDVTEVFNTTRDYVLEQIQIARDNAATDKAKSQEAIGRGLHAVQDLNSHSNLIDLSAADQAKVLEATFDNTKTLPAGFLLTSYVTTRETEFPVGDPLNYTHGAKSKDTARKNDEAKAVPDGDTKTKFELAFASGVKFSEMLLTKFETGLPAADRDGVKQLALVDPHPGDAIYQFAAEAQHTFGSPTILSAMGTTVEFGPAAFAEDQVVAVLGAPLNVFRETSDIYAPDGRLMGLLREIQPLGISLLAPATAQVAFSLSEVEFLDPTTLVVYQFDQVEHTWAYAIGGSVLINGSDALAAFSVPAGGIYAVGGFALVPEPSSLLLCLMASGLMLRWRRGRRSSLAARQSH